MSRCEHGQRISLFCVNDLCGWRQAGGCEKCFKKYHDHQTNVNTLKIGELEDAVNKTVLKSDCKYKSRTLQEAVYHYFMLMKSQISSSLDAVSREISTRITHPYMNKLGQVSTYKKIKNKEYKKLLRRDLISFYHFTQDINPEKYQLQQKKLYHQEVQNLLDSLFSINEAFVSYAKAISNYDSAFNIQFTFYDKIQEIGKSIFQNKSESKSAISGKNGMIPQIKVSEIKKTEKPNISKLLEQKLQVSTLLGLKKESIRDRKPSIDTSVIQQDLKFTPSKNYDENQREIQSRKKKLLEMMTMETPSDKKNRQKTVPPSKQVGQTSKSLENPFSFLMAPPKKVQQKEQKKQKSEKLEKKQSSLDKHHRNDSREKVIRSESQEKKQDDGADLFAKLLAQGINFPEMIIHTILPVPEQKKKLYENTEEVKEKKVTIPVRKFEDKDEISSPILKKRKKGILGGLQLKAVESNAEKLDDQIQQSPKVEKKDEKLELKQKEANSLALVIQSLPLPAQKAIPLLQTALKYAHNNLSAAQYLSYLYLQIGKPKLCLDLCNEILSQMQDSPQFYELSLHICNNKAAALNVLGRYSESISILEKCLEYSPKDIFYKNLADAYFCIGIHEKAIYNYENAIRLNNNIQEAHYNLAVCLFMQEHYQYAQLEINKALKMSPDNSSYLELNNNIILKMTT